MIIKTQTHNIETMIHTCRSETNNLKAHLFKVVDSLSLLRKWFYEVGP